MTTAAASVTTTNWQQVERSCLDYFTPHQLQDESCSLCALRIASFVTVIFPLIVATALLIAKLAQRWDTPAVVVQQPAAAKPQDPPKAPPKKSHASGLEPLIEDSFQYDFIGFYNYTLQDKSIKWLTGCRSPALAMMLAISRQNSPLGSTPALMPPAQLFKNDFAPLTGEIGYCDSISGVEPSSAAIAVEYAMQKGYIANPDKEVTAILNFKPKKFDHPEHLRPLKCSVLRLLQTGAKKEEYIKLQEHILINFTPTLPTEKMKMAAIKISMLFDTVKPIQFTPEEQDLIDHPCALVWASTTIKAPELDSTGWFGMPGECQVHEKAELGKDIPLAYTTTSNIARIQNLVKGHKVEVRNLNTLLSVQQL